MYENEFAPCIMIYDNAFDKCEEVISFAMSKDMNKGEIESIHGSEIDLNIRDVYRTSLAVNFSQPVISFELSQAFWKYALKYCETYNIEFDLMEPPDFLYYPVGGFYDIHQDGGRGQLNRIFSAVMYLNDVEEGGNIYFPSFDIEVEPKRGRLVLFPSNYAYIHQALPVIKGEKYAVLSFFSLDPLRGID